MCTTMNPPKLETEAEATLRASNEALYRQQSEPCEMLTQQTVDRLIESLLDTCKQPGYLLSNAIGVDKFYYICHKVVDVLKECETLEYVHDPQGMAVIGDLHGDFTDLMKSLNNTGWPTERTLIFLGDYIDRGQHPVEVILFLFLLKIRYRKRVILLRGNHETYEQCALYGFVNQLGALYPEEDKNVLFFTINNAFDYLPLAAIVSDQILCCHGGVSQFANSRSDIASIRRPPRWLEPPTTLCQIAIMTDILWSDPADQDTKYAPSDRHISFFFSSDALKEKLRQYNCRSLIRGHRALSSGFYQIFDGLCYTVHSTRNTNTSKYNGAVILLDFDPVTCLINGQVKYHNAGVEESVACLISHFLDNFKEKRHLFPMPKAIDKPCCTCARFRAGVREVDFCWRRCLSYTDYLRIIMDYRGCGLPFVEHYVEQITQQEGTNWYETCVATAFPSFLRDMINAKVIQRIHPDCRLFDPRPGYSFEFNLPDANDREVVWPVLDIED